MSFPYPVATRVSARHVDKLQGERRRQEAEHAALQRFAAGNQLQATHHQSDAAVATRRRSNQIAQLTAERMLDESRAEQQATRARASREAQQNEQLARALESGKKAQEQKELEIQRICESSEELRELEAFLKTAYMNKDRAAQQLERETLRAADRARGVAMDQQMEYDRQRALVDAQNLELARRAEAVAAKQGLQHQMLQRQDLRREAAHEAELERDKVERLLKQIELEDAAEMARREAQRVQTRELISQSQRERELVARAQQDEARRQEEEIEAYRRRVEAREASVKAAGEVKKAQEDAMFRAVEAEIQAKRREDEQVERLRDELWEEELLQKKKAVEDERLADRQRAKEAMMASNALQLRLKQELVARQQAEEDAFNAMLQQKFASEARRERELAVFRRAQREKFQEEIAQHSAIKQQMVYAELERERREREQQEQDDDYRRRVIEQAKQRLLAEHAEVLQGYLPRALRPSSSSSSNGRPSAYR